MFFTFNRTVFWKYEVFLEVVHKLISLGTTALGVTIQVRGSRHEFGNGGWITGNKPTHHIHIKKYLFGTVINVTFIKLETSKQQPHFFKRST